jgi:hypothetical protein
MLFSDARREQEETERFGKLDEELKKAEPKGGCIEPRPPSSSIILLMRSMLCEERSCLPNTPAI